MQIRLRKISDLRHRLEIIRNDGSRDAVELASRSFLIHDFLHYAVESRAGLTASFWGMLASGKSFKDVHEASPWFPRLTGQRCWRAKLPSLRRSSAP
jgi:hypothetical protein